MQVFVSGGAGFIGSHLTERLLERGHTVLVYDNLSTGKWENLPVTRGDLEFIQGDIRNAALVSELMRGMDAVVHLDRLFRNLPITIFGNGEQARDFVYVADVVDLLVMAVLDSCGAVCGASRQRRYDDRRTVGCARQFGRPAILALYGDRVPSLKGVPVGNTTPFVVLTCPPRAARPETGGMHTPAQLHREIIDLMEKRG